MFWWEFFKMWVTFSDMGGKARCLQGRLLLPPTCSDTSLLLSLIFPRIFYWPEISPSQLFFQIVTMILKENIFFYRCFKWKSGFKMADGNRHKQNTFYWYIVNMNWVLFHVHIQEKDCRFLKRHIYKNLTTQIFKN